VVNWNNANAGSSTLVRGSEKAGELDTGEGSGVVPRWQEDAGEKAHEIASYLRQKPQQFGEYLNKEENRGIALAACFGAAAIATGLPIIAGTTPWATAIIPLNYAGMAYADTGTGTNPFPNWNYVTTPSYGGTFVGLTLNSYTEFHKNVINTVDYLINESKK
jgi:hypothetical protein